MLEKRIEEKGGATWKGAVDYTVSTSRFSSFIYLSALISLACWVRTTILAIFRSLFGHYEIELLSLLGELNR